MPTERYAYRLSGLPLIALLLAACATADAPARMVQTRPVTAPTPRGSALLQNIMLDAHNRARAELGLPPLTWSEALAEAADNHARHMAQTRRFAHAAQSGGPSNQGETLFMGTRDGYTYAEMAQRWLDEKRYFTNDVTPRSSRTGRWGDVAHYAQIVWRQSTSVGCAMESSATEDYLVCRYAPGGNVIGQRAY